MSILLYYYMIIFISHKKIIILLYDTIIFPQTKTARQGRGSYFFFIVIPLPVRKNWSPDLAPRWLSLVFTAPARQKKTLTSKTRHEIDI